MFDTKQPVHVCAWSPRFVREGDSAWSIVHKFAAFNGFRGPTTRRLLRIDSGFTKCTGIGAVVRRGNLQILGLDDSTLQYTNPRAYVPTPLRGRLILHETLRYCPECLRVAYHSPLHQVRFVTVCPIHNVALRTGCPKCRAEISMSSGDVALAHAYGCSCGYSFLAQPESGGLRMVAKLLDTSPIMAWLAWCTDWPNGSVHSGFNVCTDFHAAFGRNASTNRAFSTLWTERSPANWQNRWTNLEDVGRGITIRLRRTSAKHTCTGDFNADAKMERALRRHARHVERKVVASAQQSHASCIEQRRTDCPLAYGLASWQGYWASMTRRPDNTNHWRTATHPIKRAILSQLEFRATSQFPAAASFPREQLHRVVQSLAIQLLELCMLGTLGRSLVRSLGNQVTCRDDAELLLNPTDARLHVWAPFTLDDIARIAEKLLEQGCDSNEP